MPGQENHPAMPELLKQRVETCYQQAEAFFKRPFPRPEVSFKLRGQKAGVAHLHENLLRFNLQLYRENQDDFLRQTVAHEVAHLVAHQLFGERIQAHGERLADFRFTPVISDADPDWPGKRGYISKHFDSSELRDQDTDMYVCGPPPMVDSIRIWLQEQQLNRVQLYYERFTESNI